MNSRKLKNLSFMVIFGLATCGLSGCGITLATVAGVTAYQMTKSDNDSQSIAKQMEQKFANSYFAIASQDKNMVIAGQVPDQNTIEQVKIYLAKNFSDVTPYSYLTIDLAESQEQRKLDTTLTKQAYQITQQQNISGISITSCKNTIYLLTNNNVSTIQIDKISNLIMKIKGVSSVITINER